MTSAELWSKPHGCFCCRQPLTYARKEVLKASGEKTVLEMWECTNEECVSYRRRNPPIPTPPQSKG